MNKRDIRRARERAASLRAPIAIGERWQEELTKLERAYDRAREKLDRHYASLAHSILACVRELPANRRRQAREHQIVAYLRAGCASREEAIAAIERDLAMLRALGVPMRFAQPDDAECAARVYSFLAQLRE